VLSIFLRCNICIIYIYIHIHVYWFHLTWIMHRRNEKCIQNFIWKIWREESVVPVLLAILWSLCWLCTEPEWDAWITDNVLIFVLTVHRARVGCLNYWQCSDLCVDCAQSQSGVLELLTMFWSLCWLCTETEWGAWITDNVLITVLTVHRIRVGCLNYWQCSSAPVITDWMVAGCIS